MSYSRTILKRRYQYGDKELNARIILKRMIHETKCEFVDCIQFCYDSSWDAHVNMTMDVYRSLV
jgi:hypothetical protein